MSLAIFSAVIYERTSTYITILVSYISFVYPSLQCIAVLVTGAGIAVSCNLSS